MAWTGIVGLAFGIWLVGAAAIALAWGRVIQIADRYDARGRREDPAASRSTVDAVADPRERGRVAGVGHPAGRIHQR